MQDEEKYRTLIIKKLANEISDSENQSLLEWLKVSERNQAIYAKVEKTWIKFEPEHPPLIPNIEESWNKLDERFGITTNEPTSRIFHIDNQNKSTEHFYKRYINFRNITITAAASIVIFISVFLFQNIKKDFTIISSKNGEKKDITLPDNSTVNLNSGSEIKFGSDLLNENQRIVTLKGQAFFDVVKDGRKFIVKTENAEIEVVGTSFDINNRDGETTIIVKTGKVLVSSTGKSPEKSILLTANQKCNVGKSGVLTIPENVNSEFLIGWLDNRFGFFKSPLAEIVPELNRRYDVKIKLASNSLSSRSVSGSYKEQTVDSTLSALCLTLDLKYSFDGVSYLISDF